jgi:Cu(I)/Ag(I) efflux system membrane fusion protein
MCKFSLSVGIVVLGALAATSGCGSSGREQPPRRPPSRVGAQEKTSQADKTAGGADSAAAGAAAIEGLKELSAEDRVAAKKQQICPVTGALLGTMGEPYKMKVQNQTVFLCCEGCKDAILRNPDKYLEKLEKAPAEKK